MELHAILALVLLILSVVAEKAAAKSATATFADVDGVQGTIKFEQASENNGTLMEIILTGLNNEASDIFIHEFPAENSSSCADDITGGIYSTSPDDIFNTTYGNLTNYTEFTTESELPVSVTLFGENSIVGRSVVIYKSDGSRWGCATIVEDGVVLKKVVALFSGNVTGSITFLQDESDPNADTIVSVDLVGQGTANHKWHIHENPVALGCGSNSTGGHYNPFNVNLTEPAYSNKCSASDPEECEVGDLFGKHGAIDLSISGNRSFFTDGNLPLTGNFSVDGRSIVIHDANFGSGRLTCASLFGDVVSILPPGETDPDDDNTGSIIFWACIGGIFGTLWIVAFAIKLFENKEGKSTEFEVASKPTEDSAA